MSKEAAVHRLWRNPVRHVRRLVVAVTGLLAWGVLTTAAFGTFIAAPSASQSISSATLAPPTALSGTGGCQSVIVGPKIDLVWTATTSAFAAGYNVLRSTTNGSGYAQIATVSGRTTVAYSDTTVSGLGQTYYYVLTATDHSWISLFSNQATATTPTICL